MLLLHPFMMVGLAAVESHQLLRQSRRNIYRILDSARLPSL